jgi:hypothetical protein
MICKRCGNNMAENAAICPICGTVAFPPSTGGQPSTSYGPPTGDYMRPEYNTHDYAGGYERGYERGYAPPPRPDGPPPRGPGYEGYNANYNSYAPPYNAGYAPGGVNVTVVNNVPVSDSSLMSRCRPLPGARPAAGRPRRG